MKERGSAIEQVPLTPAALAGLVAIVERGTISSSIAKDVFAKMYDSGRAAGDIIASEGLAQIGDESALVAIVRNVIEANAGTAAQYRAGKHQTFGFLVGQVMKASGGKANPKVASALMKRELDGAA
jgi:aspartyl-tRNA(Asn)/glutamyl-tRNA(Gln) amidotransferase subunit B